MQSLEARQASEQTRVIDVMEEIRHVSHPDTPVQKVADLMANKDVRYVAIVDKDQRLLEIISQRDVIRHLVLTEKLRSDRGEQDSTSSNALIKELLKNERPITIQPDAPLVKAALLFASKRIGCLPVLENGGRLAGVVTMSKVLGGLSGNTNSRLDTEFTFFSSSVKRTSRPAFIRRGVGDIVVPSAYVEDADKLPKKAALGYDADTKRILIKFINDGEAADETVSFKRSDEQLTFRADNFVKHFQLDDGASTYDVSELTDGRYLILTPRSLRV
jgi:CBS domain-containing protein